MVENFNLVDLAGFFTFFPLDRWIRLGESLLRPFFSLSLYVIDFPFVIEASHVICLQKFNSQKQRVKEKEIKEQ